MKKFAFPLEKVLAWRRVQAQLAESELERLHSERRGFENRRQTLASELERTENEFVRRPYAAANEFAALDAFRARTAAETVKLQRAIAECGAKIAAQTAIVTSKRRDLRLLEKLKDQRLHTWTEEANKETLQLAEESFLARWKPR